MLLSSDPRPLVINNGPLLSAIFLDYIYEKSGKNSAEYFRWLPTTAGIEGNYIRGVLLTEGYGREQRIMVTAST